MEEKLESLDNDLFEGMPDGFGEGHVGEGFGITYESTIVAIHEENGPEASMSLVRF